MADLKKVACCEIDKYAEELQALSQAIWKQPELMFAEHFAHKVLTNFLEDKGFIVERSYKLDTAFRATFGGETTTGPHVAVLCEYDALPEIGHACGHNLIAEAGVAAGLGIKAAMTAAGRQLGKLTVLGTPAEEGGGGKVHLINSGVFDDVDFAMMVHPFPFNSAIFPFLAAISVSVKYRGKASHASAFPWEGVNALDAAVMCYQGLSNLRQQFKPSWRAHTVIKHGGAKANIIPDFTELEVMIRAETDSELKILKDKLYDNFRAAATATGCSVEITETSPLYSAMVTNNHLASFFKANASSLGVKFDPPRSECPRGSTDMGNVSRVVPSIHPMYYVGRDVMNHTREFAEAAGDAAAQPHTLNQGKAMAMTAIDVFTSLALLNRIKADFKEEMLQA